MGKHAYQIKCECPRCTKERARRLRQSNSAPVSYKRPKERRPEFGSQEWAETYSDNLGESPDF